MKMMKKLWSDGESRRVRKARRLLQPVLEEADGVAWADVGCGDGVFTYLLCQSLQPDVEIYAVDKNKRALQSLKHGLPDNCAGRSVHTVEADFTEPLPLPPLDGLLLANSLHFVWDKRPVLERLVKLLKPNGRLIIIEYNATRGNSAVPYPLDEHQFLSLAQQVGLRQPQIMTRVPSSFLGQMYTGMGRNDDLEAL